MQQQRLSVEVVLQRERSSMPQAEVWILDQLRAEEPSKVKDLVYLRARLNRSRPFDAHIVDGLAGADAQGVDQVTSNQDA